MSVCRICNVEYESAIYDHEDPAYDPEDMDGQGINCACYTGKLTEQEVIYGCYGSSYDCSIFLINDDVIKNYAIDTLICDECIKKMLENKQIVHVNNNCIRE